MRSFLRYNGCNCACGSVAGDCSRSRQSNFKVKRLRLRATVPARFCPCKDGPDFYGFLMDLFAGA